MFSVRVEVLKIIKKNNFRIKYDFGIKKNCFWWVSYISKKSVFSFCFVAIVLCSSLLSNAFVIVLDPGHGGKASGAIYEVIKKNEDQTSDFNVLKFYRSISSPFDVPCVSKRENFLRESELNLILARLIRNDLQHYFTPENEPVEVIFTHEIVNRQIDSVSLENRARMAKGVSASALVSLHFNSSCNSEARGGFVIVPWAKKVEEQSDVEIVSSHNKLCYGLASEFVNSWRRIGMKIHPDCNSDHNWFSDGLNMRPSSDGEVYENGNIADYYAIIRWGVKLGVPAILLEHCFLSNPEDLNFLINNDGIRKLADADVEAIVKCFNLKLQISE